MDLQPGVYPAAVTPFDSSGGIDFGSVATLLACFESAGCQGVVVAGTNGEGPALSSFEKRDLTRAAVKAQGRLTVIAGVATPSLTEAQWLLRQAENDGAAAALVMPPGYYRHASERGIVDWFLRLMDSCPLPVLAYNYPKMTGVTLSADAVRALAAHPNLAGIKDSSGDRSNLFGYRQVLTEKHRLFVGNETLLVEALEAGWSGSISGAANVCPDWLARVVREWLQGDHEAAKRSFSVVLPVIEAVRAGNQPAANKAAVASLGAIASSDVRLPLEPVDASEILRAARAHLGVQPG